MKVRSGCKIITDYNGNTICRQGNKYFDYNFKPIVEIKKHDQRIFSGNSILETSNTCRGYIKAHNTKSLEISYDGTCDSSERIIIQNILKEDEKFYNTKLRNSLLSAKQNLPQIIDGIKITGAVITTAGVIMQNPILINEGSKLIQI